MPLPPARLVTAAEQSWHMSAGFPEPREGPGSLPIYCVEAACRTAALDAGCESIQADPCPGLACSTEQAVEVSGVWTRAHASRCHGHDPSPTDMAWRRREAIVAHERLLSDSRASPGHLPIHFGAAACSLLPQSPDAVCESIQADLRLGLACSTEGAVEVPAWLGAAVKQGTSGGFQRRAN
jgi:hypothetical protein